LPPFYFPNLSTIQLTFLPYFPYHFTIQREMIWKICKKCKLNSGKIWKIKRWQTFVRNVIIEANNVIMKNFIFNIPVL
jgi:hypothetical protein